MSSDSSAADSAGEYLVIARRYRPQSFSDLVGQEQVSQALHNAISSNRVGHAYLFTGARGVGKTSTARILAKALNCSTGPTSTPCNQCDICESVTAGEDVDVLEIDGASNRGIDEIRQLRSNVNVRPSRARFKIYIIDEVHMLTTAAFNALLKTLEEPPEHVKFLFCTTDPEKIPITVLSRCQRFDLPPVETESIIERLQQIVHAENVSADPDALQLLARRAAGSMRDSQSLLEQLLSFCGDHITSADVHALLGTVRGGRLQAIGNAMLARDAAAALAELDGALNEGGDAGQLGAQLLGYFRDTLTAAIGCEPAMLLHCSPEDHPQLVELGRAAGASTLLAAAQILDQALTRMRQSTHTRTLLEVAVVQVCQLESLDDLAQLVAQFREGTPPAPARSNSPAGPPRSTGGEPASEPAANQKKTVEQTVNPPARPPAKDVGTSKPIEIKAEDASKIWTQAVSLLEDMTKDFASYGKGVAISGPNCLVVEFGASYNLPKESCERADRRAKIEAALASVCGGPVKVQFQLSATPTPNTAERKPPPNRRQMMRDKEKHPLVSEAIEIFDAEMIRLDKSRPRPAASEGEGE